MYIDESPDDDPICQLEPARKLRLCATIFSSPPFENMIKFFPTMERLQTICEKKSVSFNVKEREIRARREENSDIYEDWMIGCKMSPVNSNDRIKTYYVSRGMRSNHVFVHEPIGDKVFVVFYMVNAGAVLESDHID